MIKNNTIYYPKCRVNIGMIAYDPQTGNRSDLLALASLPVSKCTVNSNNTLTADEFTIELVERYLPADPTNILAIQIDLHLTNGEPSKELETTTNETRLLVGHADDITRKHLNGAVTFEIKGRDFAGLLLDLKWGARVVELGRDLESVIKEIIAAYPQSRGLRVHSNGTFVLQGDKKSKKNNRFTLPSDTSLWEGLIKLGYLAGAIVSIRFDCIEINSPRNPDASSDPPVFVAGKNITSLTLSRELGKTTAPNVIVKAYDYKTGSIVEGKYPNNKPNKTTKVTQNSPTSSEEWTQFVVKRPRPTKESLNKDAELIYGRLAHKQVKVSFQTRDLTCETSEGKTAPLTNLRNGDTIRLYVDNSARRILEMAITEPERQRKLAAEGFSSEVARVLGSQASVIDKLLFVETATHSYSADDGYTLAVTATTFLEV